MKKKMAVIAVASALTFGLAGCTPGHNVPGSTVAGALAGGILGSVFFHGRGSFAGVAAGALIGGIVGNVIGNKMDARDRANMEGAISSVPVGKSATWVNRKDDVTYTVTPVRNYHRGSRVCRRYKTTIRLKKKDGTWGSSRAAYGTACVNRRTGQWQVN